MKILVLSDVESKYYWDYFSPDKLEGIDLVVSCGDLKAEYLSFIATYVKVPVLYVHGNHDDSYAQKPPEGCICIENKIYEYKGVRILGIGGSIRYKDGEHQYTQGEMIRRLFKLWPLITLKKGFDILVTHSAEYQPEETEDYAHQGFKAFLYLLDRYKPKVFVHGHIHMNYGRRHKRERYRGETRVINAYERYIFEYEE